MATDTAPRPVTTPPRRRIWQLPTFVLGLAAVWAVATYVSPPRDAASKLAGKLDDLASALDRKPPDAAEVEPLVKVLADTPNHTPRSHYLLGSGYVAMASAKPTDSPDFWKLASQHFEACDAAALNPDEIAKMTFRAAKAKAAVGRGDPAVLMAALMNVPANEDRAECPRLLAECALRLPTPDLARARDELTNYLGGPHRASAAAADRYKLQLAELNAKLGDAERARQWLKDISATAPADVLAIARMLLAKQAIGEKNWAEAATLLESALAIPGLPAGEKGPIRFLLADVYMQAGNTAAAIPYFEQAAREPGDIGAQAALRMALIRGLDPTGRGKRGEAVDWLERAAAGLTDEQIKRDAQTTFLSVILNCLQEEDFASAIRAVKAKSMTSGHSEIELQADVNAAWGTTLKKLNDPNAAVKLKAAAVGYSTWAGLAAEHYVKFMLKALPLFRQAGDTAAALGCVDSLLIRKDVDGAARADLLLARADLLPPTEFDAIRKCLEEAMNSPGPAAAMARLKLALLHVNRGQDLLASAAGSLNPDAVKKEAAQVGQFGRDLLRQVAETANVPPEAQAVHEQALFELGRLHLRDGKFTDAEARFKKQLSLYPNGVYAGYGRLWLVCSLLQQARGNAANAKQLLGEALTYLKPLTQSTDPYLRTYGEIWTANALLELGDIAAVVPMAKELMAKYQGKPEELVAGKLLFYAYLRLPTPEPAEASRTLDRMDRAFEVLPRAAYPNDPEYSYERWKSELPRLREELRKFTP